MALQEQHHIKKEAVEEAISDPPPEAPGNNLLPDGNSGSTDATNASGQDREVIDGATTETNISSQVDVITQRVTHTHIHKTTEGAKGIGQSAETILKTEDTAISNGSHKKVLSQNVAQSAGDVVQSTRKDNSAANHRTDVPPVNQQENVLSQREQVSNKQTAVCHNVISTESTV